MNRVSIARQQRMKHKSDATLAGLIVCAIDTVDQWVARSCAAVATVIAPFASNSQAIASQAVANTMHIRNGGTRSVYHARSRKSHMQATTKARSRKSQYADHASQSVYTACQYADRTYLDREYRRDARQGNSTLDHASKRGSNRTQVSFVARLAIGLLIANASKTMISSRKFTGANYTVTERGIVHMSMPTKAYLLREGVDISIRPAQFVAYRDRG